MPIKNSPDTEFAIDAYIKDSSLNVNVLDSSLNVNIQDSVVGVDITTQTLPAIINFKKFGQSYAGDSTFNVPDSSYNYVVDDTGQGSLVSVIMDTGLNEDSHKQTTRNGLYSLCSLNYNRIGQVINPEENIYVLGLSFWVDDNLSTSPSGTIYYRIRKYDTDDIIAETSENVSNFKGTANWYRIDFNSPVLLNKNDTYIVSIEESGVSCSLDGDIDVAVYDLNPVDSWGYLISRSSGSYTEEENKSVSYKLYYIGGQPQSHELEPLVELDGQNVIFPNKISSIYNSGINDKTQPMSLTSFEIDGYVCFVFSPPSPLTFDSSIKIGVQNNTGFTQKGNISYVYTKV